MSTRFNPRRRTLLSSLASSAAFASMPALLSACGGGTTATPPTTPPAAPQPIFTHQGLDGHIVHRLRPRSGHGLLAITHNGLYTRTPGGPYVQTLSGEHVFDVTAVTSTHWLASVRNAASVDATPRLLETLDGGANWRTVANDFGGEDGPEPIETLVFDGAAARLLATGYDVLAVSHDMGRRWQRLAGEYQSFAKAKSALAVDPQLGDVWYGGQDAIEGLALFRWQQASGQLIEHPGLMSAPSVVKGIRFSQGQPARVLVAGEGGIVHTPNRGASWQPLLADGHNFYFDVVQDPQRPQRWVTARWLKRFDDPQPLLVRYSDDDGVTWKELQHSDTRLFGGTWSLAVQIENGRTVYHVGLYKGGVMTLELP